MQQGLKLRGGVFVSFVLFFGGGWIIDDAWTNNKLNFFFFVSFTCLAYLIILAQNRFSQFAYSTREKTPIELQMIYMGELSSCLFLSSHTSANEYQTQTQKRSIRSNNWLDSTSFFLLFNMLNLTKWDICKDKQWKNNNHNGFFL